MRAAVQRAVFAVVSVHGFHGFLCLFQTGQLLFQLGDGLRVVLPDAAHAGTADFIKQPLDVLPFLHIAVAGRVLFFFLAYRKIGTTDNQDRGNTGVNGKTVVHVGGQLPGVGVKQAVDFLMVHGIDALFLCLRDFKGIIHIMPVLRCGAAGLVIGIAVHLLGAAGCTLIDGIIVVGRRRLLCRRLRGFLRLLRGRLRLWCCRGLIASRRVFLHGHTGVSGFLRDLGHHLFPVCLYAGVKIGKLRHFRQRFPLIEKRAALLGVVHQCLIIGRFLRRQGIAGR